VTLGSKSEPIPIDPERVQSLIQREEASFLAGRRRSDELWREARKFSPRGVPSSHQDAAPQPVFVDHGRGSRIWDVDGNEYVDFHNGFGVMVVGHAHPLIVKAVSEQVALGSHFAQPSAEVAIVARELAHRFSQPRWRFSNSGTEATLDAVRLARAFTGRERLLKIEASYHGHHDALMVSVKPPPSLMGPPDEPASVPQSEGIPAAVVALTSVIPFNDLPALERAFERYRGEIAALIVEPAMMNVGIVLPDAGYLESAKDIAHRHGALLIFDEVKTGVTIAPGGATERFGVQPDIAALAKAIGGREDIFDLIEEKRVAQLGTFNGNPLTIAASKATLLDILTPSAYAHFDALGEVLQGGLEGAIAEYALPFHVTTMAARGGVTYSAERVRNYRDYLQVGKPTVYLSWLYQCNRGVLMAPGVEENWTISVQHTEQDVQRYVDNFVAMGRDLRA
jgi:glutamate-1-semialdehyde 2,1-aminomutase